MLVNPSWTGVEGLQHGFLDGHESGGDPADAVAAAVGMPLAVAVPRQVHGTRVLRVTSDAARPEADGLSTGEPGPAVGVVTADCMPVLLVAPARRVAAAVHAGWRGAAAGILEAAVAHLTAGTGVTPADLEAAIGPAIGGCCYEVGTEVRDAFRARSGDVTRTAWMSGHPRPHLDLRTAARALLAAAGVRRVAILGPCTACGVGYHSFRRDGAGTGRQLSFVGWR